MTSGVRANGPDFRRRDILAGGSAVLAACCVAGPAASAAPEDERVKPGDRLVIDDGEHKGKPATLDLVAEGAPPLKALPVDPTTGTVREGSRFNKLLLVRVTPDGLDEDIAVHAAEGVFAYSAVCTHQGCEVSAWIEAKKVMACFCHQSEFDPAQGGKVVSGPAKARLPILPLSVENGELVVAGEFTSRPGPRG